jgi:hypothetical protein
MQHSAAAAVPRTRQSDAYSAYMHQIRGFAVLQRPRSAAFLKRIVTIVYKQSSDSCWIRSVSGRAGFDQSVAADRCFQGCAELCIQVAPQPCQGLHSPHNASSNQQQGLTPPCRGHSAPVGAPAVCAVHVAQMAAIFHKRDAATNARTDRRARITQHNRDS